VATAASWKPSQSGRSSGRTAADGRQIEHTGVDRIRVVDGKVVENRIIFDRAQFERKLGKSLDL
jgi:ketosteroid isomerase-like protein